MHVTKIIRIRRYREGELAIRARAKNVAGAQVHQVADSAYVHGVGHIKPGLARFLIIDAVLSAVGGDGEARTGRVHLNTGSLHLRIVQEPCQTGQDDDKGGYHEQAAYHETLPEILQGLRVLVGHSAITFSSVLAYVKLFMVGMLASCLHAALTPRRAAFPPCPLKWCQGPLSLKAKRYAAQLPRDIAEFRQLFNLGF